MDSIGTGEGMRDGGRQMVEKGHLGIVCHRHCFTELMLLLLLQPYGVSYRNS